jgi:assimilatory nitrate reductase catalytic subunit
VKALRERLDFLVVQDMYTTTETARLADLVLPAAGWGEKEGTFINSERRIGVTRKVARAPGVALSDFAIFKAIAEAWGCGERFRKWASPEATFQLLKELSRGRPCDITGIRDYAHLDAAGGIQWPLPAATAEMSNAKCRVLNAEAGSSDDHSAFGNRHSSFTERRLFADGRFFTPDGRARILFDPPRAAPESPDADFPFWLNTGRGSSAQWHTGSRTDKSDVLRKLAPTTLLVEINPTDAARLRIDENDSVAVVSRRGRVAATAVLTPTVRPGEIFLPMHFAAVNVLTFPAFDPHSRQPSYKSCAVRVER